MKKVNKFLTDYVEKIFIIFLFFQPLIDVLTAIMLNVFNISFTIGVFSRILFLGFIIYYYIFLSKIKNKKKTIIYLGIISIYFLLYSLNIIFVKDYYVLGYEIKNIIKTFYFPMLLVIINDLIKNEKINIDFKILNKLFIIYLLFVFIPNLFGFGFDSYKITKSGSIGLFYTANEISAIISILMPIFIYTIFKIKNKVITCFCLLVLIYTLTSMGTKGPFLSLLIIMVYYIFKYISKSIKDKKYKIVSIFSIIIVVVSTIGLLLLPKTNFYKNIVVHLEFLEVDSISDIVTNPKVIDHFIFSQRLTFWNKTNNIYIDSNISSKLLGIGYIDNYSTDQVSMKMIEMDFVDIFYRHGIVGFIIYMSSFVVISYRIIKAYFIKRKKLNSDVDIYILSFILSIILAFLTGHVITSPSVSIYVALIFNLFYNYLCKEWLNEKACNGNN